MTRVDDTAITPAYIAAIDPNSPAARAHLSAGEAIVRVEGEPLRDLIQWRWVAADEEVAIDVVDERGRLRSLRLRRREGEEWGIEFRGIVFDGIRRCANHCSFCFIDGLPEEVRPSLAVRDDDYRLSFLTGTFVTLTNLTKSDEARIVELGLSPLRVSLHAVNPEVRAELIGPVAERGLAAMERLLAAGIELHVQIVLVPGVNDGEVLKETLRWAYGRENILSVGVVPVGYTRQSAIQSGFDDAESARGVLDALAPFQARAQAEGRGAWVFAADEFYGKAFGPALLAHLPEAGFYGDFELFEDGIGIVRATVDEFFAAIRTGEHRALIDALDAVATPELPLILGGSCDQWFASMVAESPLTGRLRPLIVADDYFGGNVDVTGLLSGRDVVAAIQRDRARLSERAPSRYALCAVMFNDDGLTLDGWTLDAMEKAAGVGLCMVSLIEGGWMSALADALASASKPPSSR